MSRGILKKVLIIIILYSSKQGLLNGQSQPQPNVQYTNTFPLPYIEYQRYERIKIGENALLSSLQTTYDINLHPYFSPRAGKEPIRPQRRTSPENPDSSSLKPQKVSSNILLRDYSLGLGFILLDYFPLEITKRWNDFIKTKIYYGFALPFKVSVEYSRGVLANEGNVSIENPDLNVDFTGQFGPQVGVDIQIHPFAGSFFLALGYGYRKLTLKGQLTSYLILTSSSGSINTNSEIDIQASAWVKQRIARVYVGWQWQILSGLGYLTVPLGFSFPVTGSSSLTMKANLINPKATTPVENVILEKAEREFESDLEEQTRKDVQAVEILSTPIIGIVVGIHLT